MEMHQIRYFLALCEESNFTRAARRCKITQPSLTNAIKRLEDELGGRLFDRRPRTRLTELGRIVRPYLQEVFWAAESAEQAATAHLTSNNAGETADKRELADPIGARRF